MSIGFWDDENALKLVVLIAKFCENTKIGWICTKCTKINFMACELYLHKTQIHRNVYRMIGTKCVQF